MVMILPAIVFGYLAVAVVSEVLSKPEPKGAEDDLGKALTKYLAETKKDIQSIRDSVKK